MSKVLRTAAVVVGAAALIISTGGAAFPALFASGGGLAFLGGTVASVLSATAMSLSPGARRHARRVNFGRSNVPE